MEDMDGKDKGKGSYRLRGLVASESAIAWQLR